jgi:hypothetical protein
MSEFYSNFSFDASDERSEAWDPHAKSKPFEMSQEERLAMAKGQRLAFLKRKREAEWEANAVERRAEDSRKRPFRNPRSGKSAGAPRPKRSKRPAKGNVAACAGSSPKSQKRGEWLEILPSQSSQTREHRIEDLLRSRVVLVACAKRTDLNREDRRKLRAMTHRNTVALAMEGWEDGDNASVKRVRYAPSEDRELTREEKRHADPEQRKLTRLAREGLAREAARKAAE